MEWTFIDTWIVVAGALSAAACALLGNYLVLRRMSMMGDAISHAVLPGLAIAFLVFDVELLFLYPWAVASRSAAIEAAAPVADSQAVEAPLSGIDAAVAEGLVDGRTTVFVGAMVFIVLLTLGFVYDWRKGIFQWR